jgi:hypothetical protein
MTMIMSNIEKEKYGRVCTPGNGSQNNIFEAIY